MANSTMPDLPPMPVCKLEPMPALLPFISDFWLSLLAPHIAYWVMSGVFHLFDVYDLFAKNRIHTPVEITQRNLASRSNVLYNVLFEQLLQLGMSTGLSYMDPRQMTGMEDCDVAEWAATIRKSQRFFPLLVGLFGIDAASLSQNWKASAPVLAGICAGGHYPSLTTALDGATGTRVPAFATWEMLLAKAIYWLVIPSFKVMVGIVFLDTWEYAWHRWMHVNKWMYSKLRPDRALRDKSLTNYLAHWHSRHHRLYIPYAYGALYNHPVEGFILDTAGAGLAYKVSCMSPRMGLWFFVGSMMKTVDDHCGYKFKYDPFQHITGNNAAYHDIHHQNWGIKTNFSQPFFTFWDRILGTMYTGETEQKYERNRKLADAKEAAVQIKAE